MANESAVRAGKAFVELFADDSKLVRGLNAAKQKLTTFGKNVAMLGAAGYGGAMAAATAWATTAKEVGRAAQRTGMSAEMFSGLSYAAKKSGLDVEGLETGVRKMQKTLFDAANGSAADAEIIDRLGLSLTELQAATPDRQLMMVADAIGGLSDPTEQAGAAMEIFGKAGTTLIPLMERGSQGIAELVKEGKDLGMILSGKDVEAAKGFNKALAALTDQAKATTFAFGSAAAPILTDFLASAQRMSAVVLEWVKNNQDLVVTGVKLAAGLVAVGGACSVVAKAIGGVSSAVGIASKAMTLFAAHPAVALLLAAATATAAIAAYAGAKRATETRAADRGVADAAAAREAGERQRTADLEHLQRLGELAEAEKLNNAETAEAAAIIELLTKRYGDLGIQIDQATGKITGFAEGQAKVKKQMMAAALAEVDAEIEAANQKMKRLQKDLTGAMARNEVSFGVFGDVQGAQDAIEAQSAKGAALLEKRKAILAGQEEALKGEAAAKEALATKGLKAASEAARKAAEKEAQERQRIADGNERLMMELHALKLQQIEDEYERERAEINATYDEKRRAAEKAGLDVELVEMARRERLRQQDRKETEEADRWADQLAEDRRKTAGELQDEIDRLKIDTNEKLTPEEKAQQQMELRHAKELRQLREADGGDAHAFDLLREKQALEAKQLAMAQDVPKTLRQSVAGTFNATVVGRMGSGNQLDRIARATEKAAVQNAEVVKELRKRPMLAFVP